MSYSIHYGENPNHRSRRSSRVLLTWVCFGLFLLLVWGFWPEGREALSRMLWPGDGESTLQAAEVFVQALQCGLSFSDAAELFCIQVIGDAGLAG